MHRTIASLIGIIIFTSAMLIVYQPSINAGTANLTWSCALTANETGGKTATVIFGETPDARDGPPADTYDTPFPPPSPATTSLGISFNDSLEAPFQSLLGDYRHYPGTEKTWNLSVQWLPEDYTSPTTVTLAWNLLNLSHSEYTNITLCNNLKAPLKDMLTNSSYSFPCPANIPQLFHITASIGNTSDDNQSHNHSNPGGGDSTPANQPPIVSFTATPDHGFTGNPISFDASTSRDPDGSITSYAWTFGDKTTNATGVHTTHTYTTTGTYSVRLTITDNQGLTNTTTKTITISTANQPPTTPTITGPTQGTKNTAYTYTITSTDQEHDPIHYTIDWGDTTTNTSPVFTGNTTAYTVNHTWYRPGGYTITATASDNHTSDTATHTTYIDVTFYKTYGYLYDTNNDGILDTYYDNTTATNLPVNRLQDGTYTFTIPNDHAYLYNPTTNLFSIQPTIPTTSIPWILTISIVAVAIILLIAYLIWRQHTQ